MVDDRPATLGDLREHARDEKEEREKLEDRVKVLEGASWLKQMTGSIVGTGTALALALLIAKLSGLWK